MFFLKFSLLRKRYDCIFPSELINWESDDSISDQNVAIRTPNSSKRACGISPTVVWNNFPLIWSSGIFVQHLNWLCGGGLRGLHTALEGMPQFELQPPGWLEHVFHCGPSGACSQVRQRTGSSPIAFLIRGCVPHPMCPPTIAKPVPHSGLSPFCAGSYVLPPLTCKTAFAALCRALAGLP